MNIPILHEDSEIVVIDKPSGIVCNRAETVKEETLQDWWDTRYGEQLKAYRAESDDEKYFVERSGLVHRLDRETSGVMVLAKTAQAFVDLLKQFKERRVHKTYHALTHGIWSAKEGEISMPIGRRRDNRQLMGVREDGRESVTGYKVVDEYRVWQLPKELKVDVRGYTGFSLVSFAPKTGRTHQIRVHARHMGHPIVGDSDYGGRKRSREDRKWAPRVMLQAQEIEFDHPKSSERVKFISKNTEFRHIVSLLSS